MSLEDILERLYDLTQPLPGIGHVYTMSLMDLEPRDVQAFCALEDQTAPRGWSIRAWQWFRRGVDRRHLDPSGFVTEITHHLHLVGWWEVNHAHQSERAWRSMTDTICTLFDDPLVLRGYAHRFTAPTVPFEGWAVLNEIYRCHDVEVHMDVMEKHDSSDFDTSPPH